DLIEARTGLRGPERIQWARDQGLPIDEDDWRPRATNGAGLGHIVATYDYIDEHGALLFQVVRYGPIKTFRQRRPARPDDDHSKVHDGWVWSIKGVRQIPYRLVELIEALANDRIVFVVEGEKDVENLRRIGVIATCNPGGVGKWLASMSAFF